MDNRILYLLCTYMVLFASCNQFLDLKPIKQTAVPDRLEDLQALLDNSRSVNGNSPGILEGITDNYFSFHEDWASVSQADRDVYVWDREATNLSQWNVLYQGPIYVANVVLDQLEQFDRAEKESEHFKRVKGAALFHRAYNFFMVAQLFAAPYAEGNRNLPGIPLRTTSAITVPVIQHTVHEIYSKVVADLEEASRLLPDEEQVLTRPIKAAAYGALSRVYLSMGLFEKSLESSKMALSMRSELIDFNSRDPGQGGFERFNKETIFYSYCTASTILMYAPRGLVDTVLYRSYADSDLRKRFLFSPGTGNKSGYYHFSCFEDPYGSHQQLFTGIMSSELYLNAAESMARLGDYPGGIALLNDLLRCRYEDGKFVPYAAVDAESALDIILAERRKELVNRGLRWMDLRRLNVLGSKITITRELEGQRYSLPPNDPRWTLLIPDEVITRSGLIQNPR